MQDDLARLHEALEDAIRKYAPFRGPAPEYANARRWYRLRASRWAAVREAMDALLAAKKREKKE